MDTALSGGCHTFLKWNWKFNKSRRGSSLLAWQKQPRLCKFEREFFLLHHTYILLLSLFFLGTNTLIKLQQTLEELLYKATELKSTLKLMLLMPVTPRLLKKCQPLALFPQVTRLWIWMMTIGSWDKIQVEPQFKTTSLKSILNRMLLTLGELLSL